MYINLIKNMGRRDELVILPTKHPIAIRFFEMVDEDIIIDNVMMDGIYTPPTKNSIPLRELNFKPTIYLKNCLISMNLFTPTDITYLKIVYENCDYFNPDYF